MQQHSHGVQYYFNKYITTCTSTEKPEHSIDIKQTIASCCDLVRMLSLIIFYVVKNLWQTTIYKALENT